jgi:putative phosphatase
MMRKLRPTQAIRSVLDLDLTQLLSAGKRVLIFDLDNTLCRHGTKSLDCRLIEYLESIQAAGFQIGILTNRRRNDRDPILQELCKLLPVVSRAGKPKRKGFIRLLHSMNVRSEDAVMIGDRRWTDILGANRMGIYSIQVKTFLTLT